MECIMEHLRIGIVGNIGVGKSTMVEAMSSAPYNKFLLDVIPEKTGNEKVFAFEEEFIPEVLDEFYKDPVSNAFMAQIEFFNGRLDRQRKIEGCQGIVIEDRTLKEDYYIFGLAQKVLKNMSAAEFLAYQRTFNLMTEKIPDPDLIVYLKADTKTLLSRLGKRGRESEKMIKENYLSLLNELYEKFILRHVDCPVLIIDATENIDVDLYLKKTIYKIKEKIENLQLRVTTPGIGRWVNLPQAAATIKAVESEAKLEGFLKKNPKLISVAGNVGLGKSTLSAILERSLKIKGLYENPEDNPLLEKFLADKPQYCYDLQMHFLEMRAAHQIEGKSGDGSYIIDRSIPEDLLVFSYQFQKDGHLTQNQLDSLSASFKRVCDDIPSADLIIVLKGGANLSWRRIMQRGREMEIEGGWTKTEIEALSKWYDSYAKDVVDFGFHKGKVLEINVDKIDFTNRIHVGYIFEEIHKALESQPTN
jgi:deoxyadenosine/deoxycytidine kinase